MKQTIEVSAKVRADNSVTHAIYKGVALLGAGNNARLYAADFHNAKIDVFEW